MGRTDSALEKGGGRGDALQDPQPHAAPGRRRRRRRRLPWDEANQQGITNKVKQLQEAG